MDNDHQNVTEFPELTNRSESIKKLTSLLTNNNTLCHPSSISMGEHVHGPTFSANGTALAATSAKSNKIPSRASRCFRPCPVRSQFSQFRRLVPINNVLAKFNQSTTAILVRKKSQKQQRSARIDLKRDPTERDYV